MSEKQTFEATLEKHENMEATGITIPFDVEKVFGSKKPPVIISINGADYRTTVFRMGGVYRLPVPKEFREAAGIKAGEKVSVSIERDTAERTVEVPADLASALAQNGLSEAFARLSYTHRKEYALAVEDAKKPETRERRVAKTIGQLAKKAS